MAWYNYLFSFLIGVLSQMGYIISVQLFNLNILWQLLPIYSGWFAIQFITGNKEQEDLSNRFMNGFSLLWVGFQLGEYIIENFFTDPYIIVKTIIVVFIFAYAVFVMRLTLLKRDITRYLARIGEVSAINIAAMLFIQDLVVISSLTQLFYFIIAFVLLYWLIDYLIELLVNNLYKKVKLPIVEEVKEKPRIERLTTPPKPVVKQPIQRPQPQQPIIRRPVQPIVRQPPVNKPKPLTPIKRIIKKQ